MNFDKKVNKLRKETLESEKVKRIAFLIDKRDNVKRNYNEKIISEMASINKEIKEVKEMEFLPTFNEGSNYY